MTDLSKIVYTVKDMCDLKPLDKIPVLLCYSGGDCDITLPVNINVANKLESMLNKIGCKYDIIDELSQNGVIIVKHLLILLADLDLLNRFVDIVNDTKVLNINYNRIMSMCTCCEKNDFLDICKCDLELIEYDFKCYKNN